MYFLAGDLRVREFFNEYNPIISFVTELELLSGPEITSSQREFIQELLNDTTIIKYADGHKEDIIKVRSQKKLKLPDAIITSLAITLGLQLVTTDKALRNIHGLNVVFYSALGNE